MKTIWDENLGKISTLKLKSGVEIVATIVALTETITSLEYPYAVVLGADSETHIVPYQFTSEVAIVTLITDSVQSISVTSDVSKQSYTETIEKRKNDGKTI